MFVWVLELTLEVGSLEQAQSDSSRERLARVVIPGVYLPRPGRGEDFDVRLASETVAVQGNTSRA
jgi:hypothetical protein